MADKHDWKENAPCKGFDTNLFFDKYENDLELRPQIDEFCSDCPLVRHCFAVGVSQKEWGIWGGIFLENGKISKDINKHRSKQDWANMWKVLTTD
jgi:hypothetical protein